MTWAKMHKPNTSSTAQTFGGELIFVPTECKFTREIFLKLKSLPHPPELDRPDPADTEL